MYGVCSMHTEPVGFTLQLLHQECTFWLFLALGTFSSAILQEPTYDFQDCCTESGYAVLGHEHASCV